MFSLQTIEMGNFDNASKSSNINVLFENVCIDLCCN